MTLSDALRSLASGDLAGFAERLRSAVEVALRSAEDAVAEAIDAIATGLAMVFDDLADYGRADRIHHWIVGIVLVAIGVVALAVTVFFLVRKYLA